MKRAWAPWLASLCVACGYDVVDFAPAEAGSVEIITVGAIDPATIEAFQTGKPMRADDKQLALVSPDDGVVLPADLAPLPIRWRAMPPPMMQTSVYELRLLGSAHELRIYTSDTSALAPAASWSSLLGAQSSAAISVRLRAQSSMPKRQLLEASVRTLLVREALPPGRLVYASAVGLESARISDAASTAFALPAGLTSTCSDGLALSHDGKRVGLACSASSGAVWSLPDLTVLQTLAADASSPSFGAFDASGARFVRERAAQLEIVSVQTGAVLVTLAPAAIAAGARMAQPDWSPDGSTIVFVYWPGPAAMTAMAPMASAGPSLARVTASTSASGLETWSEPLVLVPVAGMSTLQSPRFSPDGAFVIHQASGEGKMSQDTLAIVPTEGGAAVALDLTGAGMAKDAALATFVPGARTGQAWLAFSSTRDDGALPAPPSAQLWLSAVDLTKLPAVGAFSPPFVAPFQRPDEQAHAAQFAPDL